MEYRGFLRKSIETSENKKVLQCNNFLHFEHQSRLRGPPDENIKNNAIGGKLVEIGGTYYEND